MTNYSLTRRYWMSLVGLTSSVVLDGYSLWSRYWATLLGSPPRPGAADSTQTNGATASLVIPDAPRKRIKVRKRLVAVAAVATAIAVAVTGPLISHHARNAQIAHDAASESSLPVNLDDCPTLHIGYPQGGCVAQLQTDLNIIQGSSLVVDGNFGSVGSPTYNAVIAFQKAHSLPRDGMVGPDMKKALAAALSASLGPRRRSGRSSRPRRGTGPGPRRLRPPGGPGPAGERAVRCGSGPNGGPAWYRGSVVRASGFTVFVFMAPAWPGGPGQHIGKIPCVTP